MTINAAVCRTFSIRLATLVTVGVVTFAAGVTRGADPDGLTVRRSPVTGQASFVTPSRGDAIAVQPAAGRAKAEPLDFFVQHGALFGVARPTEELQLDRTRTDALGQVHTTFRQVYRGVPVFTGELKVHQDAAGRFRAVNGDFFPLAGKLNVVPTLSVEAAAATARAQLLALNPTLARSALTIVDPGWYGDPPRGEHLAWHLDMVDETAGIAEAFLIDAHTGELLDQWTLIQRARDRAIYDGEDDVFLPGVLVRAEGDPATGVFDEDAAYDYYGDTYDYYLRAFGRDGIDDAGLTMVATVNSQVPTCPNAFWTDYLLQMVFCDGLVVDDVVGHELTHGVTSFSNGLIYQNQPGQLNESFSDVFGELIDLFNGDAAFVGVVGGPPNWPGHPTGPGTDTPNNARSACSFSPDHLDGVRWLVGEDAAAFGGAIRDMWDPTCFDDPDRANSPNQHCSNSDNGGVHSGSGVPNHAFAILTDGKSFNGYTVAGIGPIKAGAVWYRTLTTYLTSGSDFEDAYWAFNQAAADLVGTTPNDPRTGAASASAFTAADALEVDKALLAVEMNTPGRCGDEPQVLDSTPPEECSSQSLIFSEDFESGLAGWSVSHSAMPTPYDWITTADLPFGRAGSAAFGADLHSFCAFDPDESGVIHLDSPVINLPGTLDFPTLAFTHYMESEAGWDGGNVKISVNAGPWQSIPWSAFYYNGYNRPLLTVGQGSSNPLAGEESFTGAGGRWGTSLVYLGDLVSAGDAIRIRFDFGKDACFGVDGWYVDDVRVYDCTGEGDCNNNGVPDEFETAEGEHSNVVLANPSGHGTGYFSDSDLAGPLFVRAQRFNLFAPTTIETIRLWGGYYPNNHAPADDFTVIFHADGGGFPGATLSTQAGVPVARALAGYSLVGTDEWEFTIELPIPVNLAAGDYWVEIYNDTTGDDDVFFWSASTFSSGWVRTAYAEEAPGAAWYTFEQTFNLAIELIAGVSGTDCNTNGVPDDCEPADDCNSNGVPDICDLAGGTSDDCNTNGVPDDCDVDVYPFEVFQPSGITTPNGLSVHAIFSPPLAVSTVGIQVQLISGQGPATFSILVNGVLVGSDSVPAGAPVCMPLPAVTIEVDAATFNAAASLSSPGPALIYVNLSSAGACGGSVIFLTLTYDAATSADLNSNSVPDECETDCNLNGVPDDIELDGNDCNANSVPDDCDPDCNTNGTPDDCEALTDCNNNATPDECELAAGTAADCNANTVPDECETDCNTNGTPDDCEAFTDCNNNATPDECELAGNDCNTNNIPDECETDCNNNGTPDDCEVFDDCNTNGTPDECELAGNDCNANGVPDECDLVDNDCNTNGVPDDCDASGLGPMLEALKLVAGDGETDDRFGGSVAVSGDVAVIGAGGDDDMGVDAGAAYVYRHNGLTWVFEMKLTSGLGQAGDQAGASVAVSGDTIVLGAPGGSVAYAFRFNGSTWIEEILLQTGTVTDMFGHSVAVDGDVALIGAHLNDDFGPDAGAAYVLRRFGTLWLPEAELSAPIPEPNAQFGYSVSLSGSAALIGEWRRGPGATTNADLGSAYVYRNIGTSWLPEAGLNSLVSLEPFDKFGTSVSISGNVAFVGAEGDDDFADAAGAAYVFRYNGSSWSSEGKLAEDGVDFANFGHSVSVLGESAIVGANRDDIFGFGSGVAYLYQFDGLAWTRTSRFVPCDGAADDQFGESVALAAGTALIGAWQDDDSGDNSGSAYFFEPTSADCDSNGILDECELSGNDCNGDGILDACGLCNDCNSNGVPDECDPDCNTNGVPDACEAFTDCNSNGQPDECELAGNDCNANNIPDECDPDCNSNGTPDECEAIVDCNSNSTPDECELAGNDCNGNSVPDECDLDCNTNGTPDDCEAITDCNNNATPDECELAGNDCNSNGVPDECDPDCNNNGTPDDCEAFEDCNSNGTPDECDIAGSTSIDVNDNDIPDECEASFDDCNSNGIPDDEELTGEPLIFWLSNGSNSISRANGDGTDELVIVNSGLAVPDFITVDRSAGKIYWTERNLMKIERADLDGGNRETLISTGLTGPGGIGIDPADDKMYWCDNLDSAILRADLDGSNVEEVINTGLTEPLGLALDLSAGKMYWTDRVENRVYRASLSGTNIEEVVATGGDPRGIAIAPAGGKLYWANSDDGTIERANLDGSGAEIILSGQGSPLGVAVDVRAGKIYWAGVGYVRRANLDGSGDEDVASGSQLRGVAVLPPAEDCNANGTLDACEIAAGAPDCNSNGVPDDCDLAATGSDCDNNGALDVCDLATGAAADCNANATLDSCDIASATSSDCNGNEIPDECEDFEDCNTNAIPDECELAGNDCNANNVPDECDPDCNNDATPDDCQDLDDCNTNGTPDVCEIVAGSADDCNFTVIPDECEIASGASQDCNGNQVPDECQAFAPFDFDIDGDVDLNDYQGFVACMGGPNAIPPVAPPCVSACLAAFDSDADLDVDLHDASDFLEAIAP